MDTLVSVRRDRQLGAAWLPEQPTVSRRLAVADDPLEMLRAGICPFCGAGPFTVVALHTRPIHGVDRFALRDQFGLTYSTSVCDPAHSRSLAKLAIERLRRNPEWLRKFSGPGAQGKHVLSEAGIAARNENLRLAREAAAQTRAASKRSKPHPCIRCGKTIARAKDGRLCSDECRAEHAVARYAAVAERNRERAAERPRIVPTCHPEREHAGLGLCASCYGREWRSRAKS
jgi:predicted nucleic acid-binding Zn ribbon protein